MPDNLRQSRLLADLPFDVLLEIFSECDVDDILNLSATSKKLNQASGEHQTWLNQVTRLRVPIPTGIVPSTAELKNWAVSWVRSDEPWVKPSRDEGVGNRSLSLHWFDVGQGDPDRYGFAMAGFIPGGKFVVLLYNDGQIDLKEIIIESEDKWNLQDVAQHKRDDPEECRTLFWSHLLTETDFGRPLVAYVDQDRENLQVFLIDHVAGIIERKQAVKLDDDCSYGVYGIHARGNTILWFYDYDTDCGWGLTVSELGSNPTLESFTLAIGPGIQPEEIQFFMVSENAVVICDLEGIHLYHIPELSSEPNPTGPRMLSPVWEWPRDSKWFGGSVCMVSPQHPVLYLQGISGTHTITFRMDANGRDPVVVNHHITEKFPARLASLGDDDLFVMKGRKGLHHVGQQGLDISEFATYLVGREELTGGFSAGLGIPGGTIWEIQEVELADFDERTGRILIGTNWYASYGAGHHCGSRIYLADLPP